MLKIIILNLLLQILNGCGGGKSNPNPVDPNPVDPNPVDQDEDEEEENSIEVVSSNITGTKYWTANNTYLLQGGIFVDEGAELHIEAGTVIKGMSGEGKSASYLCVARGAKIFAEGTADAPIIFTSVADSLDGSLTIDDRGLWGGVIVLGKAQLNLEQDVSQIEWIPATQPLGQYGGDNDADNSGVITYVSIRHGGTMIGADGIKGLTLGGVGSGTTINNIEVYAFSDDGIQFFGGTVSIKKAMVAGVGDDSYDWDEGYRGQENSDWVAIASNDTQYQRGGEHDGGRNPETGQPYAKPTITDATFIGNGKEGTHALTFRDNSGGNYSNSVFFNYAKGVDIEDLDEGKEDSYAKFISGDLTFKNNVVDCDLNAFVTSKGTKLSDYFKENNNSKSKNHGLTWSTWRVSLAGRANWAHWTLAMKSGWVSPGYAPRLTEKLTYINNFLVAALDQAGLVLTLRNDGPFTVFAPTDKAFAEAGIDLAALNKDLLTNILLYHVVSGAVPSSAVTDGMVAPAVNGDDLTFSVGEGVMVKDANVILADVLASNGVIHVIDKVLMPSTS